MSITQILIQDKTQLIAVASENRLRQKRINVNLDSTVHDRFKAAVSADGKKMTEVVVNFIQRYIQKAGKDAVRRGGNRK